LGKPKRGLGAIFLGPVGIGKTSMLFNAPKPAFFFNMLETGFADFEVLGQVPQGVFGMDIPDYNTLLQMLKQNSPATVILDSLTGFQQLLFNHIIQTVYGGDKKKFSAFSVGPRKDAPTYLPELFGVLESLLKKGTHVFITCHRAVDSIEDPLNPDHVSYILNLDKGIRERWEAWAPNILMFDQAVNITSATKSAKNEAIIEGKALNEDKRLMYTTASPGHPAKNKIGLPSYIILGRSPQEAWNNFWQHVPPAFKETPDEQPTTAAPTQPGS